MALKPDRQFTDGTDISFFMNETGEKGEVLVFSTAGSGAAMDDANAVVTTPTANPSGQRIAGILLNDVVNLDLTRQHINQHKDEVQLGGKVTLLRRGIITTNIIATGGATSGTPTAGAPAYVCSRAFTAGGALVGQLTTTAVEDYGGYLLGAPDSGINVNREIYRVGTFLSTKDSDGYAKVDVNIR